MSCSTTPVVKHLPQCCISTVGTKTSYPFLSLPSKPIKLTHLSCSSTWVSLSLTNKTSHSIIVPLVAQNSDYAQQDGEEEGSVNGFQLPSEVVEETEVSEDGSVDVGEDGEYQEPPEEAKIFVGNLPFDCDSEKLAHLFEQAGVVEIAEVIYNRDTEQSRGFGFVTMSTVEEAEKAVEMFHRHDLDGRFLTVNKAAPRGSRPERVPRVFEPSFRIYVGNLPWQVDNSRLEQVFSEHGKVLDARVVYDRETGRSRGFGFVTMSSETELNDAIAALDGESMDGRAIRVNVAEERPRRGAF